MANKVMLRQGKAQVAAQAMAEFEEFNKACSYLADGEARDAQSATPHASSDRSAVGSCSGRDFQRYFRWQCHNDGSLAQLFTSFGKVLEAVALLPRS